MKDNLDKEKKRQDTIGLLVKRMKILLDSSRFPRFIQALARVSLHIPRACPRDMQGYEG